MRRGFTLVESIVMLSGVVILAVAIACMLGGCSPVKKRIIAKELMLTDHFLIADDGSSTKVSTREYYRISVGDSVSSTCWYK